MTKEEVLEIIETEGLRKYNWFNSENLREDQVVIFKKDDKWCVCATTERASIMPGSDCYYDTESEALERFLFRLRAGNRVDSRDWKNFKG